MPMVCPSNTVENYTLAVVLEDSEPNMIEQSTASSAGPAVSLEVGDLMENEAYTYSIVAINAIGRATTASTSFRMFLSRFFLKVKHSLFYSLQGLLMCREWVCVWWRVVYTPFSAAT